MLFQWDPQGPMMTAPGFALLLQRSHLFFQEKW